MIRACPHHEYEENHLNTFLYDRLDSTKALLDSAVGGKLSKLPCNQVKAKIREVAKNSSWGGARISGLPRGMIDARNLNSIGAKIEAMEIGHTSTCHDPTPTCHILLHNRHQTLLQPMITFPLK